MDTSRYSMNIVWSEEDECFVVTFHEFPNLSAFGGTYEEAVADAKVVLEMALVSLSDDGISAPKPQRRQEQEYSGQVRLRMPKSLHKELSLSADSEGVSMNTYIVSTLSGRQGAGSVAKRLEKRIDGLAEKVRDSKVVVVERSFGERVAGMVGAESSFHGIKRAVTGKLKKEDVCLRT